MTRTSSGDPTLNLNSLFYRMTLKSKSWTYTWNRNMENNLWHDDWIVNLNSGCDLPTKQTQIGCTVFVLNSFVLYLTPWSALWSCVLCRRRSDVSVVLWSQVEKRLASCAVNPRLLWGDASPSSPMITALPAIRPPTTRWVHRSTSDATRGECRSLTHPFMM